MINIIDYIMAARRTVVFLMLIVISIGLLTYINIAKDAEPDIDIPFIYIGVAHQGISPEDAERLIVKPLENQLKTIEGLEDMMATAVNGFGSVLLEFDIKFDKDKALGDVREKVDMVKSKLPSDAEEPVVLEFNMAEMPTLVISLSGDIPDRTLFYHAKRLQTKIEAIPGVLEAPITGDREDLMEILVSPSKLENYNISLMDLIKSITGNNRLVAAGSIDKGQGKFSIKVPAVYESAQDVYNLVIFSSGEGTVTLGDVAEIRKTYKDTESYARVNGKPAVALQVKKRIGENVLEINKIVREESEKYTNSLSENIKIDFTSDNSDYILEMLNSLQAAVINAIVSVMILVIAALGIRSALMVGISIPTSFLLAITILGATGGYINMMVMFGLLVSVGLLVDGSIVMVEYADRKMAEGLNRLDAYTQSYKRMLWPIVSSTATTLAAFLPLILWPGVSGEFMKWMPFMVSLVLISSLFSALIFIPVMGSLFGKTEKTNITRLNENFDINKLTGYTRAYVKILSKLIKAPIVTIVSSLIIVVILFNLYANFNAGARYSVEGDTNQMTVHVIARGNLSPSQKLSLALEVEDTVRSVKGIKTASSIIGGGSVDQMIMNDSESRSDEIAMMMIELNPVHERRHADILREEILKKTSSIPGIFVEAYKIERKPESGKDIQLELTSLNNSELTKVTEKVSNKLKAMDGVIEVDDTRSLPGIEWVIEVDRELAGKYGVDVSIIGAIVQLVTNGILVDKYRPDDSEDEVDIRVRFPKEYRQLEQFDQLRIPTPDGAVPLSNFVKRIPQQRVSSIDRENGSRILKIRANTSIDPATGKKILPFDKNLEISDWIKSQNFSNQVNIKFAGTNEDGEESAAFLGRAMLGALFLMFVILLTQFNSFYQAAITLSTVVLSTVGALTGLLITGQVFSVIMSGLGIVSLAGIIVNNSIVLIDTYNRLKDDEVDPIETIIHSAAQRLRPIVLTTATTMIGLTPVALQITIDWFGRSIEFGGLMSAWWVPFSTAVIWGLGFSSLLTLFLIPTLLALPIYIKNNKEHLEKRFFKIIESAK
ncbi:MAG: efflux RND transporter permease subunit [Alphaproteobacteria bacterium]|nr:transporter [Rhodobiaceae bacterium]PDH50921.1 MAG: transporter [alpha proteobacterium MED-G09]